MEHGENQIVVVDDDGNEQLCEILFTFESEDFGKSYVLYYPAGSEDENGQVDIHASSFLPGEEEGGELQPIESEEEWDMIEQMLATFLEEDDE
ncbi:DUF1292 domain-containing protein [Bacillus fonticola]|uniref:DUF1292 domain-containing protein n=1 Tax=Bacillus fonticola TaxID=2728853 RepID=UPI001475943A|nr:DUF1292 domain-containing protein [Bacillus fonticola]